MTICLLSRSAARPPTRLGRPRRPSGLVAGVAAAVAVASFGSVATAAPGDTVDGRFAGEGRREAGSVLRLDVAGRGGVARDAVAVAVNVTVTETAGPGHVTVYPCDRPRPTASSINHGVGATVANAVVSAVGADGDVCVYTHAATHLVVDVDGYVPRGSGFRAVHPSRMLDTRSGGVTVDGRGGGGGPVAPRRPRAIVIAGRADVGQSPRAVTANVTVTGSTADGHATLYPCDAPRPDASTVNFAAGATIANGVMTAVAADGTVCVAASTAAHVVVDITGWFPQSADVRALSPSRVLDTRPGHPTVDGRDAGTGRPGAGHTVEVEVADRAGIPADATAVALNVTAVGAAAPGFVTVFPCGAGRPPSSTLNHGVGETIANGVIVAVGSGGRVCLFTHAATDLVVDVGGAILTDREYRGLTPARLLDTRDGAPPSPGDPGAAASLALLNELRARHGAGPLVLDAGMSADATAWSREMARSGFRHSSLGYAENIAWHSATSMSPDEAAATLHDMWEHSPGHFRNMTDPRWTRVGIGLFVDSSAWWGTHVFR